MGRQYTAEEVTPTPEDVAFARDLIMKGYMQTSARYRLVARVPPGMTAIEALREIAPDEAAHVLQQAERHALLTLLRVYITDEHKLTLTVGQFRAFKQLGGEPA